MPNPSVEAKVTLRLAFDVGEPLAKVGKDKRPYEMSSFVGDGMLNIGDQAVPVERFQLTMFKREGDPLYPLLRSLKRGDRVVAAIALEVRPYVVEGGTADRPRTRWALQPGQVYSLRVLERAQVGELLEV